MSSSSVEITLNYSGVGSLLQSSEMATVLSGQAEKIRSRCGDGYAVDTYSAGTRVIASVYTETTDAMQNELENNTLLKAIGGG